jgi:hypothetical protein
MVTGKRVRVVERQKVEALPQYEDVRCEVSASAGYAVGHVVTSIAGVRVRRGKAVERTVPCERMSRVSQRLAIALRQRAPAPFLLRPVRHKEPLAVLQKLGKRSSKLLVILQVTRHSDFPPDSLL